MAVTIVDVARHAQVGVGTVSRVINGADHVRPATRQRVEAAMRELAFHPNAHAGNLKRAHGSVRAIGYLFAADQRTLSDPFFSRLVLGMADAARELDYDLHIASCKDPSDELNALERMMRGNRISGVVLTDTRVHDERITLLQQREFPFVAFGRTSTSSTLNPMLFVDVDGSAGVCQAVSHLIDQGHRRIGFIALPMQLMCAQDRLEGYRLALKKARIRFSASYVVPGGLTEAAGESAAESLLQLQPRPSAIVACSDVMAFGAMRAIQRCGLVIGNQVRDGAVALVGFDDVPMAAHTTPPLTTVRQPVYDIGRDVVNMLVSQLATGRPPLPPRLISPELVIRESA
jgi:DNA-binding LacI/PurR family transcriptional regulator